MKGRRRFRRIFNLLVRAALAYVALIAVVFVGQIIWGGVRDPDADLRDQDLKAAITPIVESVRKIVVANRTPTYQRDAHAKPHGCVKALFEVPRIGREFAHGLFAMPGTYEAWIRLSNGTVPSLPDTKSDARGMAIKVMGVKGKQLLDPRLSGPTQDFLMVNSPAFFIRSMESYVELERFQAANTPFKYFFAGYSPNPFKWRMRELYLGLSSRKKAAGTPLDDQYYSMSAYRLGPHEIKFSAKACQDVREPGVDRSNPNFLRDAMKAQLRRGDACYQFMVQVRDPDARMPIEDTTVRWSETRSPFVPVARIYIPPQDFDTPAQNAMCEGLSFNPWHGLEAHQPLGKINELRRELYLHTAAFRQSRNGIPHKEPSSWCDSLPALCSQNAEAIVSPSESRATIEGWPQTDER